MWNTEWFNGHSVGFRRGPLLADLSYGSHGVPTSIHRISITIAIPRQTLYVVNYQAKKELYHMFKDIVDNWEIWVTKHFEEEYFKEQIEQAERELMERLL